jgi:hypothetical protein
MLTTLSLLGTSIVAAAYYVIAYSVAGPLVRTRQWSNRLGWLTAAIFFSCAVGHSFHAMHHLHGSVEIEFHDAAWEIVTGAVAVAYLLNRAKLAPMLLGGGLFDDAVAKQRQAVALNDRVFQHLIVVQHALDLDEREVADRHLASAIEESRSIVTGLLPDVRPGALRIP